MSIQESFKILLLADTHIGLDFPVRPRLQRRRRGHDFLNNFRTALQSVHNGHVDAVVHGGDLFDRSNIPDALVRIALEPLLEAAQAGIPVFLVPGNHERGKIPLHLWRSHPNLHIFDEPSTYLHHKGSATISFSGFPFTRKVRSHFASQVKHTGFERNPADIRLLCMHQAVEGAQVGPANFTFRNGDDVVRGADLPQNFDAVLSGHIHRAQALHRDLKGRTLPAPVVYPGSVERTAFAEQREEKGYLIVHFSMQRSCGRRLERVDFHPLPARPMVTLNVPAGVMSAGDLRRYLQARLSELDPHSVVRIRLDGKVSETGWQVLSASGLRALFPDTMNVTVAGSSFIDT